MGLATLKEFLTDWTLEGRTRGAVAETVLALAGESDEQKEIDVVANNMIAEALKSAPVAALASEEELLPRALQADAPLLVAIDPFDGSSNVDANVSVGTIFSILPSHPT